MVRRWWWWLCVAGCSGASPTTLAKLPAIGIAIDANSVYFTDIQGELSSMPKQGGPVTLLAPGGSGLGAGVAVDAAAAYYMMNGALTKVPFDGSAPTTLDSGHEYFGALLIDDTNAYWRAQDTTIQAVPLTGGSRELIAAEGQSDGTIDWGIASDADWIYFATSSHVLWQVDKHGDSPMMLAMRSAPIVAIASDGTYVYWLERTDTTSTVMRIGVGGDGMRQLAQVSIANVSRSAIALDARNVYWTDDQLRYVPLDGGDPGELATANAWALAVDDTAIYWADDNTDVKRIAKP